jgi:2-dehydropantoate 2-reductase
VTRVIALGAGALGSVLAGAFARAGAEVALIDRDSAQIEAIRRDGLLIEGALGRYAWRGEVATSSDGVAPGDLVLVMVHGTATVDVAPAAARLAGDSGFVLTLQNGIGHVEALAAAAGEGRVLAGATYNSAALLGPGRTLHSNAGETVLGPVQRSPEADRTAAEIARLLSAAGLEIRPVDDPMPAIWSKFLLNVAINPVAAVTGLRPGEIAREPAARALLERVLDEALAVIDAKGIQLPEPDPRAHVLDHAWVRYNRPSMLQHVEQGRPTEIEPLTGALVREARALGVPVPVNEALRLAVLALEARARRRADPRPLDEAALEAAARDEPRPA